MFKMYLLYRIFKTLDSEIEDKINIFEFRLLLQLWAEVKRQGHGTDGPAEGGGVERIRFFNKSFSFSMTMTLLISLI